MWLFISSFFESKARQIEFQGARIVFQNLKGRSVGKKTENKRNPLNINKNFLLFLMASTMYSSFSILKMCHYVEINVTMKQKIFVRDS